MNGEDKNNWMGPPHDGSMNIRSVQVRYILFNNINEPRHEKNLFLSYTNNKGADQPAHPRSLISTFVVRCLDSIYIRNFKHLASFCGCAGRFESYLVENSENRFSRDEAQITSEKKISGSTLAWLQAMRS